MEHVSSKDLSSPQLSMALHPERSVADKPTTPAPSGLSVKAPAFKPKGRRTRPGESEANPSFTTSIAGSSSSSPPSLVKQQRAVSSSHLPKPATSRPPNVLSGAPDKDTPPPTVSPYPESSVVSFPRLPATPPPWEQASEPPPTIPLFESIPNFALQPRGSPFTHKPVAGGKINGPMLPTQSTGGPPSHSPQSSQPGGPKPLGQHLLTADVELPTGALVSVKIHEHDNVAELVGQLLSCHTVPSPAKSSARLVRLLTQRKNQALLGTRIMLGS
ncbi:hypothetical protein IWQ62_001408 [Dispira parvispora]|uniref:Uncharacterized protein n=1 Tax=Dispira parvispora TaxID=1520584 RepID=A0A9W8AV35_9FUNG|nr:hypothetical protein IWQ62_001408 [Dispira parvispora]